MNSPEAERTPLSPEEESRYADIVGREFHGANPEEIYEQDTAHKFDSLVDVLIAKQGMKGVEGGIVENERDLETTLKIRHPDITKDEYKGLKSQTAKLKLHVMPADKAGEKHIAALFDHEGENVISTLIMLHDHDGELIHSSTDGRVLDWNEIFDRIGSALMKHESKNP